MHVMQSILQKQTPNFFKTEGRGPGAPVLDPSLLSPVNPNPLQAFVSRKKTCSRWKYITYFTCFHLKGFFYWLKILFNYGMKKKKDCSLRTVMVKCGAGFYTWAMMIDATRCFSVPAIDRRLGLISVHLFSCMFTLYV